MSIRKQIKKIIYGKCPGFAGSFPYFGTKVYFPVNYSLFERVCDEGIYEQKNIEIISSLTRPNSIYFDVGANIGLMAIPVLDKIDSCKVVSFEPSPNTLQFLNRTVQNSRFSQRWFVISKAVSSEIGSKDFCVASSPRWAPLEGFKDTKRAGNIWHTIVSVTTIDREWEAMGKPQVSVIKIDVEGAELQVLQGSLNCIAHEQPYIVLEWNNINLMAYDCDPDSLFVFAKTIDYEIVTLPDFTFINSANHLKVNMLKTESFLLMPG
jgi:FkbM family methyltransferase